MSKGSGGSGKGGAGKGGGLSGKSGNSASPEKELASAVSSGDTQKQARIIADDLKASDWDLPFLPKSITIGKVEVALTPGSEIHKAVSKLR